MVIGGTGHQSLPVEVVEFARTELGQKLSAQPDLRGVCSLAAGADQLFAESVLGSDGKLWVVIPCSGYEESFDDKASLNRYRTLLQKASTVEQLDFTRPSEEAYFAAGQRIVELSDTLIAMWDGKEARGRGGTADVVAYARRRGCPVEVLWIKGTSRD